MSKFLKAAQQAIRESGLTHEQLATEVGTERQRISELMNKDNLRGTLILEKVLSYLKKEEFENLVENKADERLGVHKIDLLAQHKNLKII